MNAQGIQSIQPPTMRYCLLSLVWSAMKAMTMFSTDRVRRWMRVSSSATMLLVALCLSGCGYALLGAPGKPGASSMALAVAAFTNHTHEPGLENRLAAALRQTVLQSHTLQLASQATASHRLQGTVREVRTVPLSFDANDSVLQYRVEVDVRIRLTTGEPSQVVWEQEIATWAEYLVSRGRIVREEVVAREAALARLADQFASKCTALLTIFFL